MQSSTEHIHPSNPQRQHAVGHAAQDQQKAHWADVRDRRARQAAELISGSPAVAKRRFIDFVFAN